MIYLNDKFSEGFSDGFEELLVSILVAVVKICGMDDCPGQSFQISYKDNKTRILFNQKTKKY